MSVTAPLRTAPPPPPPSAPRRRPPRPAPVTPRPASGRSAADAGVRGRRSEEVPAGGRLPFAMLVGAILVAGLVGLLMLHTLAAQDAFRVHDMAQRLSALSDQEQQLRLENQQLQAPDRLQSRAAALGMRPTSVSGFRRLHDGRAVGVVSPVLPPPVSVHPVQHAGSPAKAGQHRGKAAKPGSSQQLGTAKTSASRKHAHQHSATSG